LLLSGRCASRFGLFARSISPISTSTSAQLSVSGKKCVGNFVFPCLHFFSACLARNPSVISVEIFVPVSFVRRGRVRRAALSQPTARGNPTAPSKPVAHVRTCGSPPRLPIFISALLTKELGHLSTGRDRALLHRTGWCTWLWLFFNLFPVARSD
jgi:hypothetical protein